MFKVPVSLFNIFNKYIIEIKITKLHTHKEKKRKNKNTASVFRNDKKKNRKNRYTKLVS